MLVDVHTHLDAAEFKSDIAEVVKRAEEGNLKFIINCGLNPTSNRKTVQLSKKFPLIKPAFGFYPSFAILAKEGDIENEIEFIKKQKPFAVSEVGLDFMKCKEEEKQKRVFAKFIELAEKLKIPIIVHSRKAEQAAFDMLKSSTVKKVVMHCFTGSLKLAKKMADEHWLFSIPPIIAYSKQFQELVKTVSLQNLLTESDAPYLGPVRGERNEPANVKFVIEKIAEVRQLDKLETEKIVFMNFQKTFLHD